MLSRLSIFFFNFCAKTKREPFITIPIFLFCVKAFEEGGAGEGTFLEKFLPPHILIKTINTYRPYPEQELRERDFLPSYRQQPIRW